MSDDDGRPDLVSLDYWTSAQSAFHAATCCYDSELYRIFLLAIYPALWNLIGFAIEASLKAFLVFNGISPARLCSREFGHDLQVLKKQAGQFGLEPSEAFNKLLDEIAPLYVKHQFRYLSPDAEYRDLPVEPALATVRELLDVMLPVICDLGGSAA